MGFLDFLHGTSDRYLQSRYYLRDALLLKTTPMRILVPARKAEDAN